MARKVKPKGEATTWDVVLTPPAPKLDHPTMADMFAYLLEVEGHRDVDPDATGEYGYAIAPNFACGVYKGGGNWRGACPSCVALRLYRHGQVGDTRD
jgi:hypothetical protein